MSGQLPHSACNHPLGSSPSLVVFERAPRWAVAARQAMPGVAMTELRAFDDILPVLQGVANGVLLLEVPATRAPQVVSLLVRLQLELPGILCVACVAASDAWERLLREAGAAWVLKSPRRFVEVARCLERHLERATRPGASQRDRVWDELPWPEAAAVTPDGA